jgi:hypothetical protein
VHHPREAKTLINPTTEDQSYGKEKQRRQNDRRQETRRQITRGQGPGQESPRRPEDHEDLIGLKL